jgi:hypothetical protein
MRIVQRALMRAVETKLYPAQWKFETEKNNHILNAPFDSYLFMTVV